jgi:MSHA biogenesis protein MshJ
MSAMNLDVAGLKTTIYERYTGMSLRERALVTLSVLAVTWMIWSSTIGGALEESKLQIQRDIDSVYARMQIEVAQQTALETAKANDPNVKLGRERVILNGELLQFTESMGAHLGRFVAPERMPALLEDIIRRHRGLKLTRIHSLPVETVVVGAPRADGRLQAALRGQAPLDAQASLDAQSSLDAKAQLAELPRVYKHPMRLEFEGDYFEVLAYLAELESSEWKFGWRRLEYVVTDHPIAQVTLEIETLSQEKGWIGV